MPGDDIRIQSGRLYVFEGPDGIGKSTLIQYVAEHLENLNKDFVVLSFPGKKQGTLGKLVYELHHNPKALDVDVINNISLQLLHIASHIDCIKQEILPALASGKIVLLDRYWWSTMAYGITYGIQSHVLGTMIELEKMIWGSVQPQIVFLVSRTEPFKKELSAELWHKVTSAYSQLAKKERKYYPVQVIKNVGDINEISRKIIRLIEPDIQLFLPSSSKSNKNANKTQAVQQLSHNIKKRNGRWFPTKTTSVFDTYWKFACKRQSIFFNKFSDNGKRLTDDAILQNYKFTNTYRASDRVSQYLIRHVIYEGDQSPEEVFFRIILFKTFNKIETWKLLKENVEEISYKEYDFNVYDKVLSNAMKKKRSIYSAAYIMPSGSGSFGHKKKHRNHLKLFGNMMNDNLPDYICDSKSMQNVFELLRQYPMIGDFLAYQYTIDINYSELTNFSEMSFVVPGPGAKDGIRKCFSDYGGLSEVDLIKCMADRQEEEFSRLGIKFQNLWGRPLQLIDCQNLFCEVDKYARIAHPEIIGLSGRTRIKQIYRPNPEPIEYFYPPKWGINKTVSKIIKLSDT